MAHEFGVDYQPRRSRVTDAWRRTPVRPTNGGVGLIADSLLWGAVIGGVLWGPGTARQRRRRRLGLCLACGYAVRDTDGTVRQQCPECGAAALERT